MPKHLSILALAASCLVQACSAARVVTNRCERVFIDASGTVSVSGSPVAVRGATTPGAERLDINDAVLRNQLAADTGVTWVVSSGDGSTSIAVSHRVPLTPGAVLTVSGPTGSRLWGLRPPPSAGTALASVILPGLPTTTTTGTITVVGVSPLQLQLTMQIAGGGVTRSLSGSIVFSRGTDTGPCFT